MRKKGTKYEKIDTLPSNALVVSLYAKEKKTTGHHVVQRYDRFVAGTGFDPGYTIKCFQGINFVIPQ